MSRFLGRSAEKRFSTLCSDNGITCNESKEDDHGWDHIVEFPDAGVAGTPPDLHRPIPPVFVQTKSHKASGLRVTMKFSNALKLARSDSPCFVVLMTRATDGSPIWHAVHFWDQLMSRVFKRARELTLSGESEDSFHDRAFSFTMSSDDNYADNGLLPWMKQTVMSAGQDYSAAKRTLHGKSELVGTVSFAPNTSVEDLVDHSLGLTPSISIGSITISEKKFGVAFPLPIPSGPTVFASMQSHPTAQCDIRLRGPDGTTLECVADVIAPAIPNLSEEHRKLRFRAPLFDVIWSAVGPIGFHTNIEMEVRRTPKELEDLVRLISWSGQGEIDARFTIEDQPLMFGTASLDGAENQPAFAWMLPRAEMLSRLSKHLKARLPEISLADVWHSESLAPLYGFYATTEATMRFALSEGEAFPDVTIGIGSAFADVGEWIFGAIQKFPITERTSEGGQVTVVFGTPILLECYAFHCQDEAAIERTEADFHRLMSKPGVFGMQNMHAMLKRPDTDGQA